MSTFDVSTAATDRSPRFAWGWVAVAGLIGLVAAQAHGVLTSPPDRDMAHLQKIMYVHVPAAWNAFIAFFVVAIASLRYLWKGQRTDDLLAASAAEVGSLLTGLTLVLGMLWGRPAWGIWWTWEPRTTSTAVLFFMFLAYLILRRFVDDPERRAQWSAVVGILGALNVPIVYMSVRWWRTLHQVQSTEMTLDASYTLPLRLNALAMMLVVLGFIAHRYHSAQLQLAADDLEDHAALLDGGIRA
ncbi:MAG: cytochrome c biogenesis protein CcsA [Gemmatimonadaceae bacterium]|nr:cytochrome c biogenesis protein CcsA [Gemmatimonadaceae bacterium]